MASVGVSSTTLDYEDGTEYVALTEEIEEEGKKKEIVFAWYIWALVVCIDIIGPFSSDSYIPSLSRMRKELGASEEMAALTLQANWLAKGLATVIVGGASDGEFLGRRGTITVALFLYVVGTAGCSIAQDVKILIFFRVIQGIGESCTVVCSAIARDVLTDVAERVRIMALLGVLRPIAIVIAPTVGGLLGTAFGWRNVFRALTFWGTSLLLGTRLILPETRPINTNSNSALSGFGQVLRRLVTKRDRDHRLALASILVIAFGFAGVMSFLSVISILFEERYGLSVINTSILMGSIPLILIFVNALLAFIFRKKKEDESSNQQDDDILSASRREAATNKSVSILKSSLCGLWLVIGLNFFLACGPRSPLRTHFLPMILDLYLFALIQAPTMGPAMALAIQPFPDVAGAAASVNNIARTIFSTSIAQLATDFVAADGVRALFLVLGSCALASQSVWILVKNDKINQPSFSRIPPSSSSSLLDEEEEAHIDDRNEEEAKIQQLT